MEFKEEQGELWHICQIASYVNQSVCDCCLGVLAAKHQCKTGPAETGLVG